MKKVFTGLFIGVSIHEDSTIVTNNMKQLMQEIKNEKLTVTDVDSEGFMITCINKNIHMNIIKDIIDRINSVLSCDVSIQMIKNGILSEYTIDSFNRMYYNT